MDVQADLLELLNTRVVVPLINKADGPMPADRLNPVFKIEGEEFVMVTQFLSAVPLSELMNPRFNLADSRDEITKALDLLLQGF